MLHESVRLILGHIATCFGPTDRRRALDLIVSVASGEATNASSHSSISGHEGPADAPRASALAELLALERISDSPVFRRDVIANSLGCRELCTVGIAVASLLLGQLHGLLDLTAESLIRVCPEGIPHQVHQARLVLEQAGELRKGDLQGRQETAEGLLQRPPHRRHSRLHDGLEGLQREIEDLLQEVAQGF